MKTVFLGSTTFVSVLLCSSVIAFSQTSVEGTTIWLKDSSGALVETFVPDDPSIAEAMEMGRLDASINEYKKAGYWDVLQYTTLEKLAATTGMELLPNQKKATASILKKYRSKVSGARSDIQQKVFELKYLQDLEKVLLPEQVTAFAESTKRFRPRFYSALAASKTKLLTPIQHKSLVSECELLNREIAESLREIREIEEKCRSRYRSILGKVAGSDQEADIEKEMKMSVESFSNSLNVKDMLIDTQLEAFKEVKR